MYQRKSKYGTRSKRGSAKSSRKTYAKGYIKKYRPMATSNRTFEPYTALSSKGVMPQQLKMNFTYSETSTITSTLGSTGTLIFRGNSPFDPNQTGTGAQPPGFDQMAPFYHQYSVYASKVEVHFISQAPNPAYLTLIPTLTSSTNNNNYDLAYSLPRGKRAIISNTSAGGHLVMYNYAKSKDIVGNSVDERDNHGTFTTNPTQQWYWVATAQTSDQSTATFAVSFSITYYCVLFNRLPINNS